MPRLPQSDAAPLYPTTAAPVAGRMIPHRATFAIMRIARASYDDIKARLVALDEAIGDGLNQYQRDFIIPARGGQPERLIFGETAFEVEE